MEINKLEILLINAIRKIYESSTQTAQGIPGHADAAYPGINYPAIRMFPTTCIFNQFCEIFINFKLLFHLQLRAMAMDSSLRHWQHSTPLLAVGNIRLAPVQPVKPQAVQVAGPLQANRVYMLPDFRSDRPQLQLLQPPPPRAPPSAVIRPVNLFRCRQAFIHICLGAIAVAAVARQILRWCRLMDSITARLMPIYTTNSSNINSIISNNITSITITNSIMKLTFIYLTRLQQQLLLSLQ